MVFRKIKGLHLQGKKELTYNNEAINFLSPHFVYIPLAYAPSSPTNIYEKNVNIGDDVYVGTLLARRVGNFSHGVYSSVSGKVTAIKKMWHPMGRMVECLEIENDYKNQLLYDDSVSNPQDLTRRQIIDKMEESGLVGLGGGGFPTYIKYNPGVQTKYLIINAVECEPYLSCDHVIIMTDVHKILRGVTYMMKAANVNKAKIVIKKNKKDAINVLKEALKNYNGIELFFVNDVYPAGWEKYIVQKVTKNNYNLRPSEVGAIVNNIHTAYSLCDAVEKNQPLIERYVTFSGEGLKNPVNVLVKIGTLAKDVIKEIGGYQDDLSEAYLICGGPMTGKSIYLDDVVITPNVSGITILKKEEKKDNPNCLGCGKCATYCPAFLTPTEIKHAYEINDVELLIKLNARVCAQCGLCSYVCPSRIDIAEYVGKAREVARKASSSK